jgi:predicted RNase H-like HicB family nuclease
MENLKFVYTGIIIKEADGYSALCPELDVASEGETIVKAKNNILDAVILYVETAIESNLPILRPMPSEDDPRLIRHPDIAEIFKMNVEMSVGAYA